MIRHLTVYRLSRYKFLTLLVLIIGFTFACFISKVYAGDRFTSSYPCSDSVKTCVSSGIRIIDGFEVHKDCWEWSYTKSCNYPSKNDCEQFSHCYAVSDLCLLKDNYGNCVNLKREVSCKSWQESTKENKEARVDLVEKDGQEGLVCSGIPCIDGNCVDKSYMTNGEMMDSISKLYAASNMKPDKDYNFNLFAGFASHCSKKAAGYSNCCPDTHQGWGKQLGAKCTKNEKSLMDLRDKKLCVDVGKENKQKMGVKAVVKHHFCCFGSILEKVIQVEGRKQLGMNFGSGGKPNCRGLTIEEIQRLDFSKMDFSEFIKELTVKFTETYKIPNPKEIGDTIKSHMSVREYDGNENNPANKFTGLNTNIKDDSWEAQEERKLAMEHAEKERQSREAAKLELERQQLIKEQLAKEQLAKEQEAKKKRKLLKEQRLAIAKEEYKQAYNACYQQRALMDGSFINGVVKIVRHNPELYHLPQYPEFQRRAEVMQGIQFEIEKIEKELKSGNY